MLIDWREALVFVTREPDWKPRIGLGGLLMLVVPPIGWVLDVLSALRLIATVPRLYAEAWVVSLIVSAMGVAIVPLMPWLLSWSYLVISHLFLQLLARVHDNERAKRAAPQLQQVLT